MTDTFHCRSCGHGGPQPVLSLGETPLANALVDEADLERPEARFPLDLVFCPECTLVQITETVPPETLFADYPYFSSFSDTMLAHADALATRVCGERGLGARSLVVEVASNDGYLLQFYRKRGVPVLGIEPARNVAAVAEAERGVPTLCEFFTHELAERLVGEGRRADVIHANNVLAHVPDPNGFARGLGALLRPDGVASIEVPYLLEMIDQVEFDTIYHEHLSYFSVTALCRLFERHGLVLADVERLPIHGGSLRAWVAHRSRGEPGPAVQAMLAEEARRGADGLAFYLDFSERVGSLCRSLRELLARLRGEGARIAAYGAAAKGSTLLHTLGIEPDLLDFVADRSSVKQGRYMPGLHIPIVPPTGLLEDAPDYVLLLTWNFADEILAQQAEYRRRGGRFIVPLPEPRIV